MDELKAIVDRAQSHVLSEAEHATLRATVETLGFVTSELESKDASIERLRSMLFGAKTETSAAVLEDMFSTKKSRSRSRSDAKTPSKRKGHGRNAAETYTGATTINVPHDTLKAGNACPSCPSGKISPIKRPAVLVRVTG
ncbi:MAG: hypothetical protein GY743_18355, partial [Planctomycetaceae bacterium]|nr:hypothetical protein [Planctomycetaceae bacterium]